MPDSPIRFLGSLVLLGACLVPSPDCVSAQVVQVNPTNGHTYFSGAGYSQPVVDIATARGIAAAAGGYLVALNDADEQQWILDTFNLYSYPFWIGLSDEFIEGDFQWDSGEPLTYTNWGPGQPDDAGPGGEDFVWMNEDTGEWEDAPGDELGYFIAETEETLALGVGFMSYIPVGTAVTIFWNNTGTYSEVRVLRDGTLIATLPGDAEEYFDDEAAPGRRVYTIQGVTTTGELTVPRSRSFYVPDPNFVLKLTDETIVQETTGVVETLLSSIDDVAGVSLGVCHGPSQLDVVAVEEGVDLAATNGGAGPDFFATALLPDGLTLGFVVSFFGTDALPPGDDLEIVVATYLAIADAPVTAPLELCQTLGNPPVSIAVVLPNGFGLLPVLEHAEVTIVSPSFIRGDCDGDGGIGLPDAIFLAINLFDPTENFYPCHEACESNGDGTINLADVIHILLYLFAGGAPPGAPFPECGPDPDPAGSFECDFPPPCP